MSIYKINGHIIKKVDDKKFKSESEIQNLVSSNIDIIFGLDFISNEFSVKSFRFDTLAFDEETKSFVIIEYKNTKSFSVVDQGMAYMATLLNNKAEFVLEYNDKKNKSYNKSDVDWSATRVIFISPYFNSYQIESINFQNLPIELWKIDLYQSNLMSLVKINAEKGSARLEDVSTKDSNIVESVKREIKVYDEDYHIHDKPDMIIELYRKIRNYIENFDDEIEVKYTKVYIGFRINKHNFCDLTLLKSKIRMWVNIPSGHLDDNKNLFRDVSNIGHWGNGDYDVDIKDDSNIEYIISKVKEAYIKVR
jgi:predicted transport protein